VLRDFVNEINCLLDSIVLLETENVNLKDSVNSLSNANTILKEEKALLEDRILELEENPPSTLLNATIDSLKVEIDCIKKEKETLLNENTTLVKEIEDLKTQNNINLSEVKAIIEELKGLIANA
jgi:FtsZ-binding cell division protein ZapB